MALDDISAESHAHWVRIDYDGGMTATGHLFITELQAKKLRDQLSEIVGVRQPDVSDYALAVDRRGVGREGAQDGGRFHTVLCGGYKWRGCVRFTKAGHHEN